MWGHSAGVPRSVRPFLIYFDSCILHINILEQWARLPHLGFRVKQDHWEPAISGCKESYGWSDERRPRSGEKCACIHEHVSAFWPLASPNFGDLTWDYVALADRSNHTFVLNNGTRVSTCPAALGRCFRVRGKEINRVFPML
jgi:hypothetical protein